mgnify:FL=1
MKTYSYIVTGPSIILFVKGKNYTVKKTDEKFLTVLEAINQNKSDDEVINLLAKPTVSKDFNVQENTYKGNPLHPVLVAKLDSLIREGIPAKHLEKFFENLSLNPSSTSIAECYDFLSYKELPITEDGCFLAYKGIDDNDFSVTGNLNTKVLQGEVNSSGKIKNTVGSVIKVERNQVDDDRSRGCSFGLHVGSLNYAAGFGSKVVVVKVNPAHVVSVPSDCSNQKCRVSEYEVVANFEGEILAPVVSAKGEEIVKDELWRSVVSSVERYIAWLSTGRKVKMKLVDFFANFRKAASFDSKLVETLEKYNDLTLQVILFNELGYAKTPEKELWMDNGGPDEDANFDSIDDEDEDEDYDPFEDEEDEEDDDDDYFDDDDFDDNGKSHEDQIVEYFRETDGTQSLFMLIEDVNNLFEEDFDQNRFLKFLAEKSVAYELAFGGNELTIKFV